MSDKERIDALEKRVKWLEIFVVKLLNERIAENRCLEIELDQDDWGDWYDKRRTDKHTWTSSG